MQSNDVTTFVPKKNRLPLILGLVAVLGLIVFGVSKLQRPAPTMNATPLEQEYAGKKAAVEQAYAANEREIAEIDRKLAELRQKKTDLYNQARGIMYAYCQKDNDRKRASVNAAMVLPEACADDYVKRQNIVPFLAAAQ